ncbi:MAG: hypothetical protein K0R57_4627 [Paenibacillaceae bacterium]|jgi:GTPase SAR1 family protein|nr:hypothetical protein [Paenibacillaceae bacterium]
MDKLEELNQIEHAFRNRLKPAASGLWEYLSSIHSLPGIRERVGIEAIPLVPYIRSLGDGTVQVISLTAVPVDISGNEGNILYNIQSYMSWYTSELSLAGNMKLRELGKLPESSAILLPQEELARYSNEAAVREAEKRYIEHKKTAELPQKLADIYLGLADQFELDHVRNSHDQGLDSIIAEADDIIRETGNEELVRTFRNRTQASLSYSQFKIAVAGEFSTGKSTLINRLLHMDLLPVSILPATSALTRIKFGPSNKAAKVDLQNKYERIDFSAQAVSDCMDQIKEAGQEAYIAVEVPNDWLDRTDIQLIDTPGAGDIEIPRLQPVYDLISTCDGVIFTMSALRAFSLTEKTFIEQHILARRVPHIAVVLSRLDQVDPGERELVIKSLLLKLKKLHPQIALLIPQEQEALGLDDRYSGMCGISAIKSCMEEWIKDENHIALKNMQYSNVILEMLGLTQMFYEAVINRNQMKSREREAKLKELDDRIRSRRLVWEDYRLNLEGRAIENSEWVKEELDRKKANIAEDIILELKSAPNPKIWWNEYFPISIRRRLEPAAKTIENGLSARIAKDMNQLHAQMEKDFGSKPGSAEFQSVYESSAYAPPLNDAQVKDINTIRLITRAGMAASTVIGFVFFGPLGIAISAGGAIASEIFLNNSIKKQKESLQELIPLEIGKANDCLYQSLKMRLTEVYNRVIRNLQKNELEWLELEKKTYQSQQAPVVSPGSETKTVQARLSRVNALIVKIKSSGIYRD